MAIFVHNPLLLLAIAAAIEIAGLLFRGTRARVARLVHAVAGAWIAAGLWELWVMTFRPEWNIRVDLLLILPILALLSASAVIWLVLAPN
jgi:hypothetical protein